MPPLPSKPHCYCLIPDVSGNAFLAVPAGEGLWTLPTVEHDDVWFAHASTAVARNATERYGIPITALREHTVADCRVCELEIQAPQWTPPAGTHWIACSDLAATTLEPAALSALLRAWFFERESGAIPSLRPAWERPGWYAEAVRWILSECTRLGYATSGPVEQLKAAWSLSSILRVNSSVGALYFKADCGKPPSEPAVIDALARRWPRNVPAVVAADHDRGWMLMRDFGERSLDGEPIARWQAANRTFATIQVACSADLEPWWRLGCPDLRIPILAAYMDRLLGDNAALRIDEPGGLTTAAATRLRELVPRLHDLWDELAAIPIPASIVQQDFRHGNLVMSGRSYVFYDWSDTVVSHPFFACCRFLDFVHRGPHPRRGLPVEERRRRIADAYLEPWTSILGHADLQRGFELARRLNPIYVAIRWYLDAPYCEPTSSWGRGMHELPARELRHWLARMDKMASGP
jgi:hypothetical protein